MSICLFTSAGLDRLMITLTVIFTHACRFNVVVSGLLLPIKTRNYAQCYQIKVSLKLIWWKRERERERERDRQTDDHRHRQTDRPTDRPTDRQTDRPIDTGRQTDKRIIKRRTDTEMETEREASRHTYFSSRKKSLLDDWRSKSPVWLFI